MMMMEVKALPTLLVDVEGASTSSSLVVAVAVCYNNCGMDSLIVNS